MQYISKNTKLKKVAKVWLRMFYYTQRGVWWIRKSGIVKLRFTLPSHFSTTPTPGKEGWCEKILRFDTTEMYLPTSNMDQNATKHI